MQRPRPLPEGHVPARLGPDGVKRSVEMEDMLNRLFATWLSSPVGVQCMAHLRSVTIDAVTGPLASAEELRHLEGRRFIVAYMSTRKTLYEKAQRHADLATKRRQDGDAGDGREAEPGTPDAAE